MRSPSAKLPLRNCTSGKKRRRSMSSHNLNVRIEQAITLNRLLAIKKKLEQQRQHIDELEKHMYGSPQTPRSLGLLSSETTIAQ
jgi:hypothetical protein